MTDKTLSYSEQSAHEQADSEISKLLSLVKQHDRWRGAECLNLNAAQNTISPGARALLSSRLADKMASGRPGARAHTGCLFIDRIEQLALNLANRLFGAECVELRPMSGSMANEIMFYALAEHGDTVMTPPRYAWGDKSCREESYCEYHGLRIQDIPYERDGLAIDLHALRRSALRWRPRIIVVGTSVLLFPYPLQQLHSIAVECGAWLVYDAAHVLGLIAGGAFQSPLQEGVHVVTASTQKTLPGPVGGVVLCNDQSLGNRIQLTASAMLSNYGNNRLAALAYVFAEMRAFGVEYAQAVVANAQALAQALDDQGFEVVGKRRGYTQSHQVVLDVANQSGAVRVARILEQANIICTSVALPADYLRSPWRQTGIRFGVCDVTRLGMEPVEMETLARLIRRAVIDGESTETAREITEMRADFTHLRYAL